MGQSQRLLLPDVREPKVGFVFGNGMMNLRAILRGNDNPRLFNASIAEVVRDVVQNGPVGDWNKLLWQGVGQGSEPRTFATGKHQGLHCL